VRGGGRVAQNRKSVVGKGASYKRRAWRDRGKVYQGQLEVAILKKKGHFEEESNGFPKKGPAAQKKTKGKIFSRGRGKPTRRKTKIRGKKETPKLAQEKKSLKSDRWCLRGGGGKKKAKRGTPKKKKNKAQRKIRKGGFVAIFRC